MANFVIKRDGTREPFDAEKISRGLKAASQKAGLSSERVEKVVREISAKAVALAAAKEEISTSELRDMILKELDIVEPVVSVSWRQHKLEKGGA